MNEPSERVPHNCISEPVKKKTAQTPFAYITNDCRAPGERYLCLIIFVGKQGKKKKWGSIKNRKKNKRRGNK